MQKNIVAFVIVGVLVVGAGAYIVHLRSENEHLKDTGAKPAASAAAPAGAKVDVVASAPRVLTPEQHKAMLEKLDSRGGTAHTVWFATVPNNPEAGNFLKQLQSVFEEAGWKVAPTTAVTFSLKPGVFFFMADEEPAEYVQTVAEALKAAGIEPTSGRGYRQFYEDKKKENPSWNGFELAADQDFILVIGRKPEQQQAPQP
jgi:hypothetical protein